MPKPKWKKLRCTRCKHKFTRHDGYCQEANCKCPAYTGKNNDPLIVEFKNEGSQNSESLGLIFKQHAQQNKFLNFSESTGLWECNEKGCNEKGCNEKGCNEKGDAEKMWHHGEIHYSRVAKGKTIVNRFIKLVNGKRRIWECTVCGDRGQWERMRDHIHPEKILKVVIKPQGSIRRKNDNFRRY